MSRPGHARPKRRELQRCFASTIAVTATNRISSPRLEVKKLNMSATAFQISLGRLETTCPLLKPFDSAKKAIAKNTSKHAKNTASTKTRLFMPPAWQNNPGNGKQKSKQPIAETSIGRNFSEAGFQDLLKLDSVRTRAFTSVRLADSGMVFAFPSIALSAGGATCVADLRKVVLLKPIEKCLAMVIE